jgi:hypothetical protein
MFFDMFLAEHGDQGKYPIFTKGYITPEEYRLITGKPYPDNEKVYVIDSDDCGVSFWVAARYGGLKDSEFPMVCKFKNTRRPYRMPPPQEK